MPAPHPLARRIHDRVLQLVGTALVQTEMCETLGRLGREEEAKGTLIDLRATLEQTVDELRAIMSELRSPPTNSEPFKNRAA
jgi:signal transduction histidine kinase